MREHRPPAPTPPTAPQDEPWTELRALTAARIALPRAGVASEAAAEIGTHEVVRAVDRGARHREHGEGEWRKIFDEARVVELRVHGVAGARVGEAQLRPRLILRRCRRRGCWRAMLAHGLG